MPKHTDTYARAYDCCDLILTELGRFPSIDLIRERIGVNSPVTIKKAMNEWTQHFAETHFDKINRPDIPVTLIHSVEQVWKLAVIEAEKNFQQQENDYRQTLAAVETEMDRLLQENQLLKTALTEARSDILDKLAQIDLLQQQLNAGDVEIRSLQQRVDLNEKQLDENALLLQQQTNRWQQQQEQDQSWFARRITEEKQFIEEKYQEKIQRQAMQIASLTESEVSLRQLCTSLRQQQASLQEALNASLQGDKKAGRFKFTTKNALRKRNQQPGS
jgi:hypothetical protein